MRRRKPDRTIEVSRTRRIQYSRGKYYPEDLMPHHFLWVIRWETWEPAGFYQILALCGGQLDIWFDTEWECHFFWKHGEKASPSDYDEDFWKEFMADSVRDKTGKSRS